MGEIIKKIMFVLLIISLFSLVIGMPYDFNEMIQGTHLEDWRAPFGFIGGITGSISLLYLLLSLNRDLGSDSNKEKGVM